jgi:F-type H+-transporting ATPase subunit epsilon
MAVPKTLFVTISKIDGPVFEGPVVSMTVPGVAGEMTLLAYHEALISPLKAGNITVRVDGSEDAQYQIDGGLLEVSKNQATVLI